MAVEAGPAGPPGPPGPPGHPRHARHPRHPGTPGGGGTTSIPSNALTNPDAIATNAAAWADLQPTVTITSVTIASPPVVKFTVFDSFGKAVVGLGNTSKSATAVVASYPNLSFALAKLVPGHVRRTEQVGELHRHLGAELGHGLGGAEPPEHRQHRHARRQRRRQLHLHLLPRHHDRQVAARRDDREPAEQHRRPRRRELSAEPDAPRDHRPLGQRAGDRQQHADRRHVERRRGADEAPGQRHLRLHSGDRREGHGRPTSRARSSPSPTARPATASSAASRG